MTQLLLLLFLTCPTAVSAQQPDDRPSAPLQVIPVPTPEAQGMSLPSFANSADGKIHLLWVERENATPAPNLELTRLWTATLEGDAWSAPQELARGRGWFLNWADTPRMAVAANGNAIVTWLATLPAVESGKQPGYGIRYRVRAGAEGEWTAPAWLHQDREAPEHGFVSLIPLADGRFQAAFLQVGKTPEEATALRSVLVAVDGSLSQEVVLDERTCDCCDTSGVLLPNGKTLIAYRDRNQDELRDIRYVREDPTAITESLPTSHPLCMDRWVIAGCPVNGPSLAAQDRFVALAWFTRFHGELPQVKVSISKGGGKTFGIPTILAGGEQTLGRAATAFLPSGEALVAWLESVGEGQAQWVFRAVPRKGRPQPKQVLGAATGTRADGFLKMCATPDGVLAVWMDPSTPAGLRLMKIFQADGAASPAEAQK